MFTQEIGNWVLDAIFFAAVHDLENAYIFVFDNIGLLSSPMEEEMGFDGKVLAHDGLSVLFLPLVAGSSICTPCEAGTYSSSKGVYALVLLCQWKAIESIRPVGCSTGPGHWSNVGHIWRRDLQLGHKCRTYLKTWITTWSHSAVCLDFQNVIDKRRKRAEPRMLIFLSVLV